MAIDFSNVRALAVTKETTAEYSFPFIPGEPSIVLAPATDANEAFLNERLRLQIESVEKAPEARKKSRKITAEEMKESMAEEREMDRLLISRTCARSWGVAPRDVNGNQPEFTPDNCYDFLKALPDYMFDPLRNFAANIYNFVKRPTVSEEDAERLGNA
jgi:hypothetical protein